LAQFLSRRFTKTLLSIVKFRPRSRSCKQTSCCHFPRFRFNYRQRQT
jgi:hypothetical protein